MSCTGDATDIGLWATGMWTNLGQPPDVSAQTISGWVVQPYTVGTFNTLTNQCFSPVSGAFVCPELDDAEFGVLGAMYAVQFWNYRAQAMAGAGGVDTTWSRLSEGDSTIQRASPGELMKVYAAMARDAQLNLRFVIASYNDYVQNGSMPNSVLYPTIVNDWGAGYGTSGPGGFPRGYYRS